MFSSRERPSASRPSSLASPIQKLTALPRAESEKEQKDSSFGEKREKPRIDFSERSKMQQGFPTFRTPFLASPVLQHQHQTDNHWRPFWSIKQSNSFSGPTTWTDERCPMLVFPQVAAVEHA